MSSFTTGLKYKPTGTYSRYNLPEYELLEGFFYYVGSLDTPFRVVSVEKGFITDFASIPWPINLLFKPTGKWAKAAALHDWLYNAYPDVDTIVFDAIFYEGCIVLGVNRFVAFAFFTSLRIAAVFGIRDHK